MIGMEPVPDGESISDRCLDVPLVKGIRIPVQAIIDNFEVGYSAEQIAGEIFEASRFSRCVGTASATSRTALSFCAPDIPALLARFGTSDAPFKN
jgi:hypothetical protein